MNIATKYLGKLGPIPTEVLIEHLCEIELQLDELQEKKKLIRYELLHRHKNKKLKGAKL